MKTVLFDLDGTLLPMDQERFLRAYMGGLSKKMEPCGYDPKNLISAVWAGTAAMVRNDGTVTNEEAFWNCFSGLMDRDAQADEPVFMDFYRNEFQHVKAVCGFSAMAAEIVGFLNRKGCRVVLATNPLFPQIATYSRVRWAGLDPQDFALITTYENSGHCKPNPEYYREVLAALGEVPGNCIMVGNDVDEDVLAGQKAGLQVFLLTDCMINKSGTDVSHIPQGGFPELLAFLKDNI